MPEHRTFEGEGVDSDPTEPIEDLEKVVGEPRGTERTGLS
jgi:hypothetical protein